MEEPLGVEPGDLLPFKVFADIHRDFNKGIYVPAGAEEAYSIRFEPKPNVDWGYSDHWIEHGVVLNYTGQGAPPQDQTWNRFNVGLKTVEERRLLVHVFEVARASGQTQYRYWGHWRVVTHYKKKVPEQGRSILRFILQAPHDD